jgi:4a-hydroxytetrahydrobiopterin dehydratase
MRPRKLEERDVRRELEALPGWTLQAGKLRRELRFDGFVDAWSFMSAMALTSEAIDHHPEWSNVYSRVVIELHTHDAGGITTLDLEWARRAQRLIVRAFGDAAGPCLP